MGNPVESPTSVERRRQPGGRLLRALYLGVILLVAAGLRFWGLDRASLWYDEVVTMRVARSSGLIALVERLDQIDGTRAPLHPIVLQAWLRVFGPTDLAGRSFSALCGLATVVVIYVLGRVAFNLATGRWAAWMAAVCPPLVYYSQEVRMYAWLVLSSCLSWLVFLSFRTASKPAVCLVYWLLLTSLVYSHPLGLFMVAAHGLAYLLVRRSLTLSPFWWLAIQCAVIVSIAPWLGRYLDRATDYPMPRHSLRFLLAVPIEYIGGNSWVLAICGTIIVFGLLSHERTAGRLRLTLSNPAENLTFITWAAAPPVLMYLYSYLAQPIFGPPRYHLYIAPAYLILLGHGLSQLPAAIRWPAAAGAAVLSLSLLQNYTQAVKADWRGLAEWLMFRENQGRGEDSPGRQTIVVHPSDPRFPREQLEAARYYLSSRYRVVGAGESTRAPGVEHFATIYDVYCLTKPWDFKGAKPDDQLFEGLRVRGTDMTGP